MNPRTLARCLLLLAGLLNLQTASALPQYDPDNPPDPTENPWPTAPTVTPLRMDNENLLFGVNKIQVKWKDSSWNEDGFRVFRQKKGATTWSQIKSIAAIDGASNFRSFIDQNLEYDTRYCYKIQAYNSAGRRESPVRCTKTSPQGINPPVTRMQLRIDVGEHGGGHEGTRNYLGAGLPGGFTWITPEPDDGGTVIDQLLGNRFKSGSSRLYDMNFYKVKYVGDLQDFNLSIDGQDDICIKKLALYVNGVELFNHPMRDADADCKYFKGDNDIFTTLYTVPMQDMRSSTGWAHLRSNLYVNPTEHNSGVTDYDNRFPWRSWVFRQELEDRLTGYVGHFLQDNSLYWDPDNGRRNVEISVLDYQNAIFSVDFDFKVALNNLPNPWLDVDFKLDYDVECVAGPSGQSMPFGPDSVLRLTARLFDFHYDIPTWADLAPKAFFWAWMAYDFVSGNPIQSFGSYWNPDDVAMKEFLEDHASAFTQQFDIPHLCNGLNAPPVGIDIVTDSNELVPWTGTQPEPFPDGDMPGNFALKLWGDRDELKSIIEAYFRCNPIFGGSQQQCVSNIVVPGGVVGGTTGTVYDPGLSSTGGSGTVVGGIDTGAVLNGGVFTSRGTSTPSTTGTILNTTNVLKSGTLMMK